MDSEDKINRYSVLLNIIAWGTMWGIFEATVGYLIHSFSFAYSWLIWYPVACFFMANVYRKTGKISSVFFMGLLCASIKMLNLFLPVTIDKVINPAISILFETLAIIVVIFAGNRLFIMEQKNSFINALAVLVMNTGWRLLFVLYLLFFVPGWIRDVSVISSTIKFIAFFVTQNLITSALIFFGYRFKYSILKPIEIVEHQISNTSNIFPNRFVPILQTCIVVLMLCANIVLEFLL